MIKATAHPQALRLAPAPKTRGAGVALARSREMGHPLRKFVENERQEESFLPRLAANEKLAELGRLSAGIIHEFNTPLSVIASASQMILDEPDVPATIVELVERIGVEAARLSKLARGVLSFANDHSWQGEEADVNQVLREVLVFLKYEAQKRSITVVEALDFQLPPVPGDGNRLKQIFINLIMNSLQAMEVDGHLTIETRLAHGNLVQVRFSDTGPGIPAELRERIFEPFFTTKGSKSGTGLGLFITKKLVELQGGSILVESGLHRGAVFVVTFPAVTDE